MSRNDAIDYAERLYARVPANYRAYDLEQGQPLLALLRVVAEQVANVRQDVDALWDNFFIETCDDWVVPYLGALVGTNLLPRPVGQSNRLDVRNTVRWRRRKGTPAMLRELAQAISGWPTDLSEFFQTLGWSQNLNHLRLDHPLTPDLRDPYRLSLLGRAGDPFAHAVDVKPARALDQARVTADSLGVGVAAWGTPGRCQIKNLGFFVRRLQTFALKGVTPASVKPGAPAPAGAACFTFDPLFRDTPLFVERSAVPLTRAAFDRAPWETFGGDVAVRQFGVLLASDRQPTPDRSNSQKPFSFGDRGAGLALDPANGLRLMDPESFQLGAAHFVIVAEWHAGGGTTTLGSLSTLHAAHGDANAFVVGSATASTGQFAISIQNGRAGLGWAGMPASPPARFPGATVAVRAAASGPLRLDDALYVYLPAAFLRPGDVLTYFVADDGSTYTGADLDGTTLARPADGQVYPPRVATTSTAPASAFTRLNRQPGGLRIADPGRFGGTAVLVEVSLFTGTFQALGAVATVDQPAASYPELNVPNPWPAFSYGPSIAAVADTVPDEGLLSVLLKPLTGTFVPASELIVVNRNGQSLLVYLPELTAVGPDGVRLFVADDGSSYVAPADNVGQQNVLEQQSYDGLTLARASLGQVLPIAGVWPLQQRRPVALDLCRCERNALLRPGELGVDPDRGRFALAPGDPAIAFGAFTVDFVEAFADRVGARTFDRQLDPKVQPTRLVSRSGDASSAANPSIAGDHLHPSVASALAAAADGDVIEIADSATYAVSAEILFNRPAVKSLTLRAAANQRPCLTFYQSAGVPASASLHVASPLDRLELNGLLVSGGPLRIDDQISELVVVGCTLDPNSAAATGSVVAGDSNLNHRANYLFCRCIVGGLAVGPGVTRLTIADSIVDRLGGIAVGGASAGTAAQNLQLERVTVLGQIHCDVLNASECLLDDLAQVDDRQAGCIRFSRYEPGSALPRRFQCVPSEATAESCRPDLRCLPPRFNARRFGLSDYAQLAAACPPAILMASESGGEVGAFASAENTIRLDNLDVKLREFLPVGLSAVVIGVT